MPSTWASQVGVPGTAVPGQLLIGARPSSTRPPHWPIESMVVVPSMLWRLVNTIGLVAVPTALILLPRLTCSHDTPVPPNTITPGWMVSVTLVSAAEAVAPPSVPTSTRPGSWYSRPGTLVSVIERLIRAGRLQTRQVPVGPVIVPASVRPCGSEMVGQPDAGVTVPPVGVGVGVGVGLGVGVLPPPPPPPHDVSSNAPIAAKAAERKNWLLVRMILPQRPDRAHGIAQRLLRLKPYFWRQRSVWALAIGATLVAALTEPLIPALFQPLLDNGFAENSLPLWSIPLVVIGLFGLRGLARPLSKRGPEWPSGP